MRSPAARGSPRPDRPITIGLRENWPQFALLVLVTAFVGAMVGIERATLPLIAGQEFGRASASAALSFIVTFGVTKALTNLASGWLAGHLGRRRTLIIGWILALPVPVVILVAPTWTWIVAANALLGVSQGFTWSTTVVMKIDLVGPLRRGLAMGLNEFAGYAALAVATAAGATLSATIGLREGPAYLGLGIATVGLLVSLFAVHDTMRHVALEESRVGAREAPPPLLPLVRISLWRDARLFSVSQAGLVNNLNDGLAWGLFPLALASRGLAIHETGWLVALYPATWGLCQLWTGALSDRTGRKPLIVAGMLLQGVSLLGIARAVAVPAWAAWLVSLGIGTALVYPTLLAAVGDMTRPAARAATVGVYRMWRDLGYAAGALLTGALADRAGIEAAIFTIGILTIASGLVFAGRFNETGQPLLSGKLERPAAAR